MTVESVTYIDDLNASNPAAGDAKSEGDDHIRNIKTAIKATFPNVDGAISATDEDLSRVAGANAATVTFDSGNMGVGGTPTVKFHAFGSGRFATTNSGTTIGSGDNFVTLANSSATGLHSIYFVHDVSTNAAIGSLGATLSGDLRFATSNSSSLTVKVIVKATGQVRFVPLSSDPSDAEAGDVYYNSTSSKLRVYNGSTWVDLH